ncbi:MAG: fibronectin type III domain-containing protein, partial [Lewinella sp.]
MHSNLLLKQYILFLLLALGLAREGMAQNFPVRASVTVVTPSPYLEDYGREGNVIVVLTLVDNRPSYEGFLRLTIEGNGFRAVTNEAAFMSRPRVLSRGTPLLLRGPELAPYFDLNNLDISGFGIDNTLGNGGRLPDGPITICAEFYDINRFTDPPVSNPACATRFVQQNYPPELVAPLGEIQNLPTSLVNFSWNPRHIPQPANDEYLLEIWEKLPGLTYDQIVNSTPTVRDPVSTFVPRYTFNNYDARLDENKTYIWRVRIMDRRNVRFFVNNGYSAYGEFNFGGDDNNGVTCPEPTALFALNASMNTATLGWSVPASELASGLQLRYRGPGIEGWSPVQTLPLSQDSLSLTGLQEASAYEVELCVICSDGMLGCLTSSFTTTLEDTDCGPMPSPVAIPVTEEAISLSWALNELAAGYRITWAPIIAPPATVPATQQNERRQERSPRGRLSQPRRLPTAPAPAPPSSAPAGDSLILGPGAVSAEIGGLIPGTDYTFNFCQICPDGSTACFNWTLDFNGIDDDCLTSLNFTRPDSTETTLDLAWTYNPSTIAANDSFQLIWQVSDRSYPQNIATVAYTDGAYTIEDRIPGQTYTLRVCAECTLGQPVCTDLPPFGGCPAEYTPELADLDFKRALIGWNVAETPAENTEMRYAMRSFGNWAPVVIGQFQDFDPAEFPFPATQLAETPKLETQIVYLAQLRNQCYDTLWSAWSEPVAFSTGCAVVDTLSALDITDVSATISSPPRPNASYYQFYYRLVDTTDTDWSLLDNVPTNLVELSDLLSDTTYEVKMRFWCNLGVWSDYTDVLTFRTLPPCGTPENALVDPILATAAGIEWLMGENALEVTLQYRLKVENFQSSTQSQAEAPMRRTALGRGRRVGRNSGGGSTQQNNEWMVIENLQDSVFLSELNGGSRYEFRLQSDCGVNLSEWSPIDEFTLLCAPPDQLSVDSITHESAEVTIAGLSPTAGTHEYSYRLLGDSVWQSITRSTPVATLLNLDDLATYELRVRTRCDAGQFSVWSDTLQFETLVDCRVPTNLGVSALSPTTAGLRWDVTGTVTRWEVRVWDPTSAQTQATQQQQAAPAGGEREGGIAPGTSGAVPGRAGRVPAGTGSVPAGGTSLPNGRTPGGITGQIPGPATQSPFIPPTPPDPYATWEVYSVTDPTKVLQNLRSDRKYKVVVRAECPTFGWTEYTDVLEFRTLCYSKSPDTAYVENMLETTVELNWSVVAPCLENYQVVVESLSSVNLPAGSTGISGTSGNTQSQSSSTRTQRGAERTSPGPGSMSNPGTTINLGGATTVGIYRDSILSTDDMVLWSGLVANTEYRFRVRARINKSEFTPQPVGYTTMEAWAASGGAAAGAEIIGEAGWGPYTSWVTFRTDHCAQPYDLVETTLDRSTMEISWTPSNGVNDYEVKYKLADDAGSVWAYVNVTEP